MATNPGDRVIQFPQVRPLLPSPIPVAVRPQPVPEDAPFTHPSLYFNRELSWLDFNWRVLYQAIDERTPLLERARFLAIAQSNLDEFFAKRVGGLKSRIAASMSQRSPDGLTPGEQLDLVREAVLEMQHVMDRVWLHELQPLVRTVADVTIVSWEELDAAEQSAMSAHFRSSVYPILTPLGFDPGHPFPFISNFSLSLAIVLAHPATGSEHFARVKIPLNRGRWIRIGETNRHLAIEDLVAQHASQLFRGMRVESTHLFRVTRSAELEREADESEDLLETIAEELRERRFAPLVRLEIEPDAPDSVRNLLIRELEIHPNDLYQVDGLFDYTSLLAFADLPLPNLRFPHWEPVTPAALQPAAGGEFDIFSVIRQSDVLVHHPYESFAASVERFIESAATDSRVLAIKQTLYRVSDDSRVARALIRAAEDGKQVAVLVELTASLDEQRNIEWARRMEEAGVHVTYGIVGLKTHTKITLVVREEVDAIRTYCHIGTGNYHERTARVYTDFGLFTCSSEIGNDLVNLFHYLTGFAPEQEYTHLLVAPRDLRKSLLKLVEQEIQRGDQGHIILKMNGIDDLGMIHALYRASQAGVRVDLIVRGHSRLRPGIPGVSDHIRVVSIVGRFLEHDRIWYFHNGGDPRVFLGSADWRRRNLEERIEAVVPILDPAKQQHLRQVLNDALSDNRQAWELHSDGRYELKQPAPGEPERSFQELMMQRVREAASRVESGRRKSTRAS